MRERETRFPFFECYPVFYDEICKHVSYVYWVIGSV